MQKVLLAVDDSPASMAAARRAIEIATQSPVRLRVVNVRTDGLVAEALAGVSGEPGPLERHGLAGASVLRHVAHLAAEQEVEVETVQLQGEPAEAILEHARSWRPDLLVVGLSAHQGVGAPYVGSQTRHILEFAEQPVLVVPAPAGRTSVPPPVTPAPARGR